MLFDDYNPLEKKQLQILDKDGKIVNKDLEPNIDDDTLIKMYKIMRLSRMSDEKALLYQRQGRMLTFAPAMGQEAAQVGPMAASVEKDWLVQAFRETAALLYKGVTVEQNYLYWYGNERGSRYDRVSTRCLSTSLSVHSFPTLQALLMPLDTRKPAPPLSPLLVMAERRMENFMKA